MAHLTPRFDEIPEILRTRPRWVAWKAETRKGKATKVPYDVKTGRRAKVDDPATWAPLDDARRAYETGGYSGVGFVFNGDGLCGVDLDKCRDPGTGDLEGWASDLVRSLDSYTEVSASGTGTHVLALGHVPGTRRRSGRVEIYDTGRFFVITGHRLERTPATIEDRQEQIGALCEATFGSSSPKERVRAASAVPTGQVLTDDELIEKARHARNGPKFGRLFDGDTSGYSSASEADLALVSLLAYWTHGDAAQIDRVFRRSGLFRSKWDEMRGGASYGATTIATALRGPARAGPAAGPAASALPHFLRGDHAEIADHLLVRLSPRRDRLVHDEDRLYAYSEVHQVWELLDPAFLRSRVKEFAGAPRGKDGKLRVDFGHAKGAVSFACDVVHCDGFFAAAPVGVAFASTFVEILSDGSVRESPLGPEHRVRWKYEFDYSREPRCPSWLNFLDEVFLGDDDRDQKTAFLQEFGGAALLGIAPRFQKAAVLVGPGANGKSVTIEVFDGAMPPGTTCAIPPQTWDDEYRLALLAGKRLNVVSELPEKEILCSETVKAIITGDSTTGRHIREAPFTFKPSAAHMFAANRLPRTPDPTLGFWRRFVPFCFNRIFSEKDQVAGLAKRILAAELPGVVSWFLQGASRLIAGGKYTIPASSAEELRDWKLDSDQVAQFVHESVRRVGASAPGMTATSLYVVYRGWAEKAGHRPHAKNVFGQHMRALGYAPKRPGTGSVYRVTIVSQDAVTYEDADGSAEEEERRALQDEGRDQ